VLIAVISSWSAKAGHLRLTVLIANEGVDDGPSVTVRWKDQHTGLLDNPECNH
jgi:hypothetical protein